MRRVVLILSDLEEAAIGLSGEVGDSDASRSAELLVAKVYEGDYTVLSGEEASLSDRVDKIGEKLDGLRRFVFATTARGPKKPKARAA